MTPCASPSSHRWRWAALSILCVTLPFSAVLARRIGTKSVVVPGLLLIAAGLGFLSQTTVSDGYRWCLLFFLLIGCGVGLAMAPSTDSVMGSVPKDEAGVGSATSDTSMQVGGALGVAVLGTALNLRYQHLMTTVTPPGSHSPLPTPDSVVAQTVLPDLAEKARAAGEDTFTYGLMDQRQACQAATIEHALARFTAAQPDWDHGLLTGWGRLWRGAHQCHSRSRRALRRPLSTGS